MLRFFRMFAAMIKLTRGLCKTAEERRLEEEARQTREARRHAQDVAAGAFVEHQLLQKLLLELRLDPLMTSKVEELLPLLRFADERYAATHPISFIPLERIAELMRQGHSSGEDDEPFGCHR